MICVPHGLGITGDVFAKNKSVYHNSHELPAYFVQESDNVKDIDIIKNFVMFPIIGHDGETNGVIQMCSFKQPITRLKMNKLIAMKKFLGACLDKVTLQQQNLESQVGLQNLLQGVSDAVDS